MIILSFNQTGRTRYCSSGPAGFDFGRTRARRRARTRARRRSPRPPPLRTAAPRVSPHVPAVQPPGSAPEFRRSPALATARPSTLCFRAPPIARSPSPSHGRPSLAYWSTATTRRTRPMLHLRPPTPPAPPRVPPPPRTFTELGSAPPATAVDAAPTAVFPSSSCSYSYHRAPPPSTGAPATPTRAAARFEPAGARTTNPIQ